jgi:hypothetical protein
LTLVKNSLPHPYAPTVGGVMAPQAVANIDVSYPQEQDAIALGYLTVMDPSYVPPAPSAVTPPGDWLATRDTLASLPATGNNDGDVRLVRELDTAYVWDATGAEWLPLAGGSGGGSLLFGQADGSLTASLPWRAPSAAHFSSARLTVADAVAGNVDLIHVAVNGTTVATLALTVGQTTSTTAIDVDMDAGDLLTVARLAADGGACQVQIDR